jgi:hypothetical protein
MKSREDQSFLSAKQEYLRIKEEHRRVTNETSGHVIARRKAKNILNQTRSTIAVEKRELEI